MAGERYEKQARLFKMLANPVRLEIIQALGKGKVCVGRLSELIAKRQSNISQHLSIMKNMGIIDSHREGKRVCYFLTNKTIAEWVKKIET